MSHAERLGARLRRIRQQQELSLADVEAMSDGAWKAVVVGAYERGDRAVTVARLAGLADFYGVPLGQLLPGARRHRRPDGDRVLLDLTSLSEEAPEPVATVARFADEVARARGDHNGRVLSIRGSDVHTLALTAGCDRADLLAALRREGALRDAEVDA
jgi:transcriptional regulator with XRE-family HTH domain